VYVCALQVYTGVVEVVEGSGGHGSGGLASDEAARACYNHMT
jgi:hypothetical protein